MRSSVSVCLLLISGVLPGCGTTRWTDTGRTATEQLLISDAVDRAVQGIDFHALRGRDVYFEDSFLTGVVDQDYVVSSLRQHLLASGCILKEQREEATFVVEARAGAVGTDRHDLLYGMPATTIPSFVAVTWMPTSIPEIPLVKRTDQMGVAKLAVFAYHRESGTPIWQSGVSSESSTAKDFWVLGAGPFQKGTIYDGTAFAGQTIRNPLVRRTPDVNGNDLPQVDLTAEMTFRNASPPAAEPPASPVSPAAFSAPPEPTTSEQHKSPAGPPDDLAAGAPLIPPPPAGYLPLPAGHDN